MGNKYSYKIWSHSEDNLLLHRLKQNYTIKEISKLHKRHKNDVLQRLEYFVIKYHNKGYSNKKIMLITKLKKQKIKEIMILNGINNNNKNIQKELVKHNNKKTQYETTLNHDDAIFDYNDNKCDNNDNNYYIINDFFNDRIRKKNKDEKKSANLDNIYTDLVQYYTEYYEDYTIPSLEELTNHFKNKNIIIKNNKIIGYQLVK